MQASQRATSSRPCTSAASCRQGSLRQVSFTRVPAPANLSRPIVPLRPSQRSQQRAPSRGVACQGLFGLGLPEIAVIAGIAALVFGPSKLPELGRGLGQTVKSFQTAAKEFETELKAASKADEPAAPAAPTEEAKKEVKKE